MAWKEERIGILYLAQIELRNKFQPKLVRIVGVSLCMYKYWMQLMFFVQNYNIRNFLYIWQKLFILQTQKYVN